ncbi:MAG: histidine kinase N-terminal 7TM domain-containing protein [Chloroflexota bacterium]
MYLILPTIIFIFSLLNAVIAALLFFSKDGSPGNLLSYALTASALGSFAYGMEFWTPLLNDKLAWIILRYASLMIYINLMILWGFYYLGFPSRLRWALGGLAAIIPIMTIYFLVSFPSSQMMYQKIWLDAMHGMLVFQKTNGPFYLFPQINNIAWYSLLLILIIRQRGTSSNFYQGQSLIIIAGWLTPICANILYLINIRPWGFLNLANFSFFPSALMIWYGAYRYQLVKIRPVARNILFEQMNDAILVLDGSGSLVDFNPAFIRSLPGSISLFNGSLLKAVLPQLAEVIDRCKHTVNPDRSLLLDGVNYEVSVSVLHLAGGEYAGDLVTLHDISDRLEAQRLRQEETSRQTAWLERQKIARILHDSITQYLNSLLMLAGTAKSRLSAGKADNIPPVIDLIDQSVRQALKEMRELIQELRMDTPDNQPFDLLQTLQNRLGLIGHQDGLQVQLKVPEKLHLTAAEQREIFYIIFESLNNVIQHAAAKTIQVNLAEEPDRFTLIVADDGCGFDISVAGKDGLGLANMLVRAEQIGGQLMIKSEAGQGTTVQLMLPGKPVSERKLSV